MLWSLLFSRISTWRTVIGCMFLCCVIVDVGFFDRRGLERVCFFASIVYFVPCGLKFICEFIFYFFLSFLKKEVSNLSYICVSDLRMSKLDSISLISSFSRLIDVD
jgi:hypothetical protein